MMIKCPGSCRKSSNWGITGFIPSQTRWMWSEGPFPSFQTQYFIIILLREWTTGARREAARIGSAPHLQTAPYLALSSEFTLCVSEIHWGKWINVTEVAFNFPVIRGERLGSDDRDVDQLLIKYFKKEDTRSVCQSYRQTLRLGRS